VNDDMEPSTLSRGQRYQLMLAHKAAASALENSLKDEAAQEFEEHGVRVTWGLPGGGQVITSLTHDRATVTDAAALLAWVRINHPDQVYTPPERIREAWLIGFLKRLAPLGPMPPGTLNPDDLVDVRTGAVVPGVRWVRGGQLDSVAVRNDKAAVLRMNLAAAAYAQGKGPMPGLESGESYG
jgi:hypothetical protein